jgi:hypothetical protein
MTTVIAYILVVLLVHFVLMGGALLVGFPIVLLLGWTSVSVQTKIAGFVGGIAGVALAVVFGFGLFRLLVGPDSYTAGAFIASTAPLLLPIRTDFLHSQRDKVAGKQTASGSGAIGEVAGLVLATAWFFSR